MLQVPNPPHQGDSHRDPAAVRPHGHRDGGPTGHRLGPRGRNRHRSQESGRRISGHGRPNGLKRSQNGVISDPVTLRPDDGLDRARTLMATHHVSGFPITEDGTSRGRLVGILTSRDMKWASGSEARIQEVMTRENLVTAPAETTLEKPKPC